MAYDAAVKCGGGTGAGEPPPPPMMAINRLFSMSAPTKGKGEGAEEQEVWQDQEGGDPAYSQNLRCWRLEAMAAYRAAFLWSLTKRMRTFWGLGLALCWMR